MPKKGTNIFKRKDGRWEARYVKSITADGAKKYGSVYGKSFTEAKEKQELCIRNNRLYQSTNHNLMLSALMRNISIYMLINAAILIVVGILLFIIQNKLIKTKQ